MSEDAQNSIVPINNVLAELLAQASSEGDSADFGQVQERLIRGVVEIVQSKGERHDTMTNIGRVYVGPAKDVSKGQYPKFIDFILVDALTDPIPNTYWQRGARQMWSWKSNGTGGWERDLESGIACGSPNGIAPFPEFIGREITDIRTNITHKIGYKKNEIGEWVQGTDKLEINGAEHANICASCPLAAWLDLPGSDGVSKKKAPPCADAWGYIIYVLPHAEDAKIEDEHRITEGFLAIVRGNNSGVQRALSGAKANTVAARIDGAPFVGIKHYFQRQPDNKNRRVVKNVGEVSGAQQRFIIGFANNENGEGFTSAKMRNNDGTINEQFVSLRNMPETFPFVVLSVPTYMYAPKGRPEETGEIEIPVNRIRMVVAKNNYKLQGRDNPTLVPDVVLTDEPIDADTYAAFLDAVMTYRSQGQHAQLMRYDILPIVDEVLATGVSYAGETVSPEDLPVEDDMPV